MGFVQNATFVKAIIGDLFAQVEMFEVNFLKRCHIKKCNSYMFVAVLYA